MPIRKSFLCSLLTLLVLIIPLILSGGCDIQFGGGGNGNGGSNFEIVQGTVTSIVPNTIPIEGTIAVVNNDIILSDVLPASGFFMIEGLFSGSSVRLDFREQEDPPSFATTFLNVYRGATLELGTINIENGNVIFTGSIVTNFDANLIENNCNGNSGTLEVQTEDRNPNVFVIVTVTPTTQFTNCRVEPCNCDNINTRLNIRGTLEAGNNVTAGTIENR